MTTDRRSFLTAGLTGAALFSPEWLYAQDEKKDPYADGKLEVGEPAATAEDSFSLIVLPDTQNYSEKYPATFTAQTKWIVENQKARKIAGVLHLGDITNRNTVAEWTNASASMRLLDDARIRYAYCPGNHDYGPGGNGTNRTTSLNQYFPLARLKGQGFFGGVYDKEPDRTENNFQIWPIGNVEYLILALEFGPRNDVLRWANDVLTAHASKPVILITHAFIYHDDTRYDWKKYSTKQNWNPHAYGMAKSTQDDVNDGEEIWTKLIAKHENVVMTLNGHVLGDGLGKFESKTPKGRAIPQILVNFQMRPNGGDGWLRILEFKKNNTVAAVDYSPVLGKRNVSAQNKFDVNIAAIGSSS